MRIEGYTWISRARWVQSRRPEFSEMFKCSPAFLPDLIPIKEPKPYAVTASISIPDHRRSDDRRPPTLSLRQSCVQLRRNYNHGEHGSQPNHREFSGHIHESASILLVSSDRIFCHEPSEPAKLSSTHLRPRIRFLEQIGLQPTSRLQCWERYQHN